MKRGFPFCTYFKHPFDEFVIIKSLDGKSQDQGSEMASCSVA